MPNDRSHGDTLGFNAKGDLDEVVTPAAAAEGPDLVGLVALRAVPGEHEEDASALSLVPPEYWTDERVRCGLNAAVVPRGTVLLAGFSDHEAFAAAIQKALGSMPQSRIVVIFDEATGSYIINRQLWL